MTGRKIELTRRRVLGGLATGGAASAAAGAGTFAYFSSEESSENNTISAGTLTLSVEDEGADFEYEFSNIAPGDTRTITADVENTGTIDGAALIVETTTDAGGESNLASELNVTDVTWPDSQTSELPDGVSTVEDLTSNDLDLDVAEVNNGGGTLTIELEFPSDFDDNTYQGVSVDVTHTFNLYQDESQV